MAEESEKAPSAPAKETDEPPSIWRSIVDFLHGREPSSLRASIEEAIRDHPQDIAEPGDLDSDERLMLRNILHMSERNAGDVAVPRSEMIATPESAPFLDLVRLFREAGHSRLPVYRQSLDEVVGMVHVKDVYAVIADRVGTDFDEGAGFPTIAELVRPVIFVPPSMPLVDLLTEMRRKRTHMAILVDEFGGTDGLISIEDIVEEIVGEIEDEHDEDGPLRIIRKEEGAIEADARVELDDLVKELGIDFAYDEYRHEVDTLGGLVTLVLGHVPLAGEQFLHRNGWRISVLASSERRIERLLLRPPVVAEAAG